MTGVRLERAGPEVYLRRADETGSRIQVSSGGGDEPLWSSDGREMLYRTPATVAQSDARVMAVSVRAGSEGEPELSRPRPLFNDSYIGGVWYGRQWDIARDGERFVMIGMGQTEPLTEVTVVLNAFAEPSSVPDRPR